MTTQGPSFYVKVILILVITLGMSSAGKSGSKGGNFGSGPLSVKTFRPMQFFTVPDEEPEGYGHHPEPSYGHHHPQPSYGHHHAPAAPVHYAPPPPPPSYHHHEAQAVYAPPPSAHGHGHGHGVASSYAPPPPPQSYSSSVAVASEYAAPEPYSSSSSAGAAGSHGHGHGHGHGAYGATQHIPGKPVTINNEVSYYAPLFRSVYVPVHQQYAPPAPAPTYGAPAPSHGHGHGPSGSYGAPAAPQYAIQQEKIGDAAVKSWSSLTTLQGGGYATQKNVPDGYGGYKTVTEEHYQNSPPKYSYGYHVKGGYLHTSAEEHRDGYKTTGSYSVKQPDGIVRTVQYTADEHGFHPQVSYAHA